jgi:hypothetical protein
MTIHALLILYYNFLYMNTLIHLGEKENKNKVTDMGYD